MYRRKICLNLLSHQNKTSVGFLTYLTMTRLYQQTVALTTVLLESTLNCGAWWLIGRFGAFHLRGCRFESRSSHHVGTLGKSFTSSCLWCFCMKLHETPTQYPCCLGSASE